MEETVFKPSPNSADCLKNIKCETNPKFGAFKCAVVQCKNKFINVEEYQVSQFKFHNFPTNLLYSETWKKLCGLAPHTETANLKVCSGHFQLNDYIKEDTLNPDSIGSLKKTALPSVNVGSFNYIERQEPVVVENKGDKTLQLLDDVTRLKNDIQELKNKNRCLQQSIKKKQKQVENIRKLIKSVDTELGNSGDKILRSLFSNAQISLLRGHPKKIYWTDDDLAQAFTLRHMGGRDLYIYLKNTLNYPLPSLSCVQAWAANNVTDCPNSYRHKGSSQIFYFVPKDYSNFTKWRKALKERIYEVAGTPAFNKMLICMNHFKPDDFETGSKNLKSSAVPSIFPSLSKPTKGVLKKATSQEKNVEPTLKKPKLTKSFLPINTENPMDEDINDQILLQTYSVQDINEAPTGKVKKGELEPQELKFENLQLKVNAETKEGETGQEFDVKQETLDIDTSSDDELPGINNVTVESDSKKFENSLVQNLNMWKQRLIEEREELEKQELDVSLELQNLQEEAKTKRERVKNLSNQEIEVLKKCFSSAQIRMLTGQTKSRWSLDDLAMAYTISTFGSRELYTYLRKNLKYPLPAVSNISRCYKSKYRTKNKKQM